MCDSSSEGKGGGGGRGLEVNAPTGKGLRAQCRAKDVIASHEPSKLPVTSVLGLREQQGGGGG